MIRREHIALLTIALILIGLPVAVFSYELGVRPSQAAHRVIDVTAAAPEAGGFQPAHVEVAVGETVTLRFRSVDVTHGIAIGPVLGIDLGHVDPGHVEEITLTFDKPGTYTYYCNTWCGRDHWRMRGVIEVRDPAGGTALGVERDPVIEALIAEGVDIDVRLSHGDSSEHVSEQPGVSPSAGRGAAVIAALTVPTDLRDAALRFSHTPAQGLALLREANPEQSEDVLADAIAHLWLTEVSPETVALYDKNCAACHGQTGGAEGPIAATTAEEPAAFADAGYMWEMRGDVLYAKIRRGGMGTDMPNFGTVFTREETRALVDYLWRLAFDGEGKPLHGGMPPEH